MIHPVFNIDTDKCTQRVIDCFEYALDMLRQNCSEFVTPEHLLYAISLQDEFFDYCKEKGFDILGMRQDLNSYLASIEEEDIWDESNVLPSLQMQELIKDINKECDQENICLTKEEFMPISIISIIYSIYKIEDESYARYVLEKHLGEDEPGIYDELYTYYANDIDSFSYTETTEEKPEDTPQIHAEAFINGKKVDLEKMSQKELFDKMMASAGRLMGALNSLGEMRIHGTIGNGKDTQRQRQPWEGLVTCISETYRQHHPLIDRQKELERAIRILCRKDKNNPLFLGEPGVGKTALIYGITRLIEEGKVPTWLQGKRIYSLDMASIMAGASYQGEFEKRMKTVLEGAREMGNCIIYIDEIHALMEAGGGSQSMSAAEILKPYLEDGSIRFIGTTTYQDYNRTFARKKAVSRRFGQIDVKEPSVEETIEIMQALQPIYEGHHGVRYTEDAIRYAVQESDSLIHDRFLPDKAIDIIDEAGAYLQQHPLLNKKGEPKAARYQKVDKVLIRQILTDVCRINAKALASDTEDANQNLQQLDQRISAEIYGQGEAIRQVVRSVMMSKAGLTEPNKPIASLLFVGPTGVGKTEVCKVLAQELGVELMRFDMSEYTEKHTISKLIGSPAGYVGYDEGGLLTDAIRKTPNAVLLLDEIEKAHSDIYNILLQVMDYARLTDNKGNKADFRGVILVMTSNAGAQYAGNASIGFAGGQTKGQAMLQTVKKTFKPEFLNRLSGTVVFNEMDRHMATLILDKKLRQLSKRLEQKNVTFTLTPEATAFLLEKGYNPQYGAREMDRVLNQYLTPTLMEDILFGKLRKGGHVLINVSAGEENGLCSVSQPSHSPSEEQKGAVTPEHQKGGL